MRLFTSAFSFKLVEHISFILWLFKVFFQVRFRSIFYIAIIGTVAPGRGFRGVPLYRGTSGRYSVPSHHKLMISVIYLGLRMHQFQNLRLLKDTSVILYFYFELFYFISNRNSNSKVEWKFSPIFTNGNGASVACIWVISFYAISFYNANSMSPKKNNITGLPITSNNKWILP